jgi:hypothetical protein
MSNLSAKPHRALFRVHRIALGGRDGGDAASMPVVVNGAFCGLDRAAGARASLSLDRSARIGEELSGISASEASLAFSLAELRPSLLFMTDRPSPGFR